jgi:hypothetical protein
VFQLVLPLHEYDEPAAAEPLHSVADSTAKPLQSFVDSIANAAAAGAASAETS